MNSLSRAAKSGDMYAVERLVRRGSDVNALDEEDITPVQHAAQRARWDVVRFLVVHGAEINVPDREGKTVLQRAIEARRWDVVKHLVVMGGDVDVLDRNGVSPVGYAVRNKEWETAEYMVKKGGSIEGLELHEKDDLLNEIIGQVNVNDTHRAFYNVIRAGNIELLEMMIKRAELRNAGRGLKLDDVLAKAYEELKIENVSLLPEMEVEVEKKLITLRFFMDKNKENEEKVDSSLQVVGKRIKMVCDQIEDLYGEYLDGREVDDKFMLIGKFIAQNLRILKRQLRSTYHKLPWEEIEFCVFVFISPNSPKMKESLYNLVLDQERLLTYLRHFGERLREESADLTEEDVNGKFPLKRDATLSAHDDAVQIILSRDPSFQELYDDFQLIKNIYSLNRIDSYIKVASSVNLDEDKDKDSSRLVLERTLQVIGESLKNSLESPNVSDHIHQLLLYSAPSNVRETITLLRDSLSHAHTLKKRIDLEENDNPRFFKEVQNDLRKIGVEITDILYKKNLEAVVVFLKKILKCENTSELKKLSNSMLGTDLDVVVRFEDGIISELASTKSLIQDLDVEMKDQSGFEEEREMLTLMNGIVKSQEVRLQNAKLGFLSGLDVLALAISQSLHNMTYDLNAIKNMIRSYLEPFQKHKQTKPSRDIMVFTDKIYKRVEQKMEQNSKADRIKKLLYDIKCTVEFDASRVKGLDIFKDRLETQERASQEAALEKMNDIFNEIEERIITEADRKIFKEILQDKLQKFRARENLNSLLGELSEGLVKKEEEHVVQKYTDLVGELEMKKNKSNELNERFNESDWNECKKIVESLGDKYQTLLNSVKNSLNTEKASDLSSSFKRFFSSKELNTVIDKILKTNSDHFLSYYEKRLMKLDKLLSPSTGSVRNAYELVTKYENNKQFQSAVDMLVLDLTDILENSSLWGDNSLYLDGFSPLLVGKSLRNYLAHGDVFIDSLPSTPSAATISSAILLLEANKDLVVKKKVLIGQRIEQELDNLNERYKQSVDLINKKIEMFVASKEDVVETVAHIVDSGVDIYSRDTKGWTGMHYAAQGNNVDVVKYFLDRGFQVDSEDIHGKNILRIAAEFKSSNVVKYLVEENQVDVKSVDLKKKTLLHYVAQIGTSKDVIELLLEKGALVDAKDEGSSTPLYLCAQFGHEETALALVENGADVDAKSNEGLTPLHMAAFCGHLEMVQVLLKNGATVDVRDKQDWVPLHLAAVNGRKDITAMLLENKAHVDSRNNVDATPMHVAVHGGKIQVVKELIKNGANVNAVKMGEMTPLHEAAKFGHKEVAVMLLENGANINVLNEFKESPLHTAVHGGHLDIVLALLNRQARLKEMDTINNKETEIDILDEKKCTPLYLAAMYGYRDIVTTLLMNGANTEVSDEDGTTPLQIAVLKAHEDVVEILLEVGASVHARNKDGDTTLHCAAHSGVPAIVVTLLSYGSDIEERDTDLFTPLHMAAKKGHLDVVETLLDVGADVNARGIDSITPLHMAAKYGNEAVADLLCLRGADVGAVLSLGATPLLVSASYGKHLVARALLKQGAKVDVVTNDNMSALHFAAQNGYPKVVEILLEKNANVNAVGLDSRTPLHVAAQNGHRDIAILLLDNGANVNALDKKQSMPLHLAVEKSHNELIEVLLDNKADVNGANVNKITPLHVAALIGNKDITLMLLENGAFVNVSDEEDRTPLHFSSFAGREEVVRVLLDNQSNVDSRDSDKMTPLHMASEHGKDNVATLLMDRGADVNAREENGKSPLHLAAQAGHTEVVTSLIERGAEIDARDNQALTPLHCAVENGNKDVSMLLLANGADFLARNNHDTMLHRAVDGEDEEILMLLLQFIEDKCKDAQSMYNSINARDAEYDTPLMTAAKMGKIKSAGLMLAYNADANFRNDKSGKTALHYAIENTHLEMVKILIDNKADASLKDADGKTAKDLALESSPYAADDREELEKIVTGKSVVPLPSEEERQIEIPVGRKSYKMSMIHIAAINGNLDAIVKFLEDGTDVDSRDEKNMTPLHYSAKNGRRDVVEILILNNADIDARNTEGWTPLMFATSMNHENVVEDLLENNADINVYDALKATSLHIAAVAGYTNIVECLLRNGANVETRANDNVSALHMASEMGHSDVVEILLRNGANIEEVGYDKKRALHYAAEHGHGRLVQTLLERGANIEARAEDKWTALHYAAENKHKNTIEVLIKMGANVHSRAKDEMRGVHYASAVGSREVVQLLLENGADVDGLASRDMTAAHYAASNGRKNVIEELIDHGTNINAQTTDGMTPLHYASSKGHIQVVETLLERGADFELRESHGETAEDLARKEGHSEIIDTLRGFALERENRKELEVMTENLSALRTEQKNIGLEPLSRDSSGPSCSWQLRKRRDARHCAEEEPRRTFSYEPIKESVSGELGLSAKMFSLVAMAVTLEHPSRLGYNVDTALDRILTYNRNIGDIVSEPADSLSPREKQILAVYYGGSKEFITEYTLKDVFSTVAREGSLDLKANPMHKSWLFENGQQEMIMFREGRYYQLYSTDFNFRHRFQTREDVTFDDVEGFVKAFFRWRSGTSKYKTLVLKESLPAKLFARLKDAPFWTPDQVVPDAVLLAEKHLGLIESLPTEAVREIFFVQGRAVDVMALHADFFLQHRGEITLRVEALHKTLPSLNEREIQALLTIVKKYNCPVDESYVRRVSVEERALLESYHGLVMSELKTQPSISSERLSELSWQVLEESLGGQPGVSEELQGKVLTSAKELHTSASHGAWAKGMGTQTLFFLPDIIRASNTGDVSSLAQTGAMLTGDATVNNLYTSLVNNLESVLPESRVRLLRALPVTSPVFKALTVYSIVELTKQLNSLPPTSEVRSVIEHKLGEQYMTAGLMVAELLGFEVTPLWIGLIAEQLLFEADTFRKQNHLTIPFWEALLMSLGFEQDKLRTIVEERQLADLNLAVVNKLNKGATTPYGWVINKSPKLGNMKWITVSQDQVPTEIRRRIYSIKNGSITHLRSPQEISESDGYRQVNRYKIKIFPAYSIAVTTRGKLIRSYWQRASYDAVLENVKVEFSTFHNNAKSFKEEDNVFLDEVIVDEVSYRRVPSVTGGRFINGVDPIKRDVTGVAIYVNNNTYLDTNAQRNFYVGFDPREGDLNVDFTAEGLEKIDNINVIHNLGAGSTSTFNSYNASSAYLVTVQVGVKPYPNAIEFLGNEGVFTLADKSQRVVGQYLINGSIESRIKDATWATRIFFSSSQTDNSTCNTIDNHESEVIKVKQWQCKTTSVYGKKEKQKIKVLNNSLIELNDKKYLELHLSDHDIERELRMSAEHVAILEAKGETANLSTINLDDKVNGFNITIRGDIVINSGATILRIDGKVPLELPPVVYTKAEYNKVISFYELEVHDELRPMLDTMSRMTTQTSDLMFSTSDYQCWWQNKLPEVNFLKLEGKLEGKVAFLKVKQNEDVLQIFDGDGHLERVEVTHYNKRADIEKGLILKEIIKPVALNSTSGVSYQLEDAVELKVSSSRNNATGDILVFGSPVGHNVYHRFPASDFTVDNIGYVIKRKHICAVSGEGGLIDGRELIQSSMNIDQSKPGKTSAPVGLCFIQALNESRISVRNNTLVINGLTVQHFDVSTMVYFDGQAFPIRALKNSLVRGRANVAVPSEQVVKRSISENQAQPERPDDTSLVLSAVETKPQSHGLAGQKIETHSLKFDGRYSSDETESRQRSYHRVEGTTSGLITNAASRASSSPINNMINWVTDKSRPFLSSIVSLTSNQANTWFVSRNTPAISCKAREIPLTSSFHSSADLTQFNLNGTLALADLLTRTYTNVKANMSTEDSMDALEVQALALNITTQFEGMLRELCKDLHLSMDEFQFNPVTVQSKVLRLIRLKCPFSQLNRTLIDSIKGFRLPKENNGYIFSLVKEKLMKCLVNNSCGPV